METSGACHLRQNSPRWAHIGKTGDPVLIHIDENVASQRWIARPKWMKAERIRTFAGNH